MNINLTKVIISTYYALFQHVMCSAEPICNAFDNKIKILNFLPAYYRFEIATEPSPRQQKPMGMILSSMKVNADDEQVSMALGGDRK